MTTAKTTTQEKVQALLERIEEGIQKITSGEQWKKLLKVQANFHKYSFNNSNLIKQQCPDATKLLGFDAWKKLGRYVRKGEKGIRILAPRTRSKNDKNSGEATEVFAGFKQVVVFDISQTEGEKLPSTIKRLEGNEHQENVNRVAKIMEEQEGLPVFFEEIEDAANGLYYSDPLKVVVEERMSPNQQLKTLIHEWGHHNLHNINASEVVPEEQEEIEAESVAFIVCEYLGLDTSEYSFSYIATWAKGDTELLKTAGKRIQKASFALIEKLQPIVMEETLEEPLEEVLEVTEESNTPSTLLPPIDAFNDLKIAEKFSDMKVDDLCKLDIALGVKGKWNYYDEKANDAEFQSLVKEYYKRDNSEDITYLDDQFNDELNHLLELQQEMEESMNRLAAITEKLTPMVYAERIKEKNKEINDHLTNLKNEGKLNEFYNDDSLPNADLYEVIENGTYKFEIYLRYGKSVYYKLHISPLLYSYESYSRINTVVVKSMDKDFKDKEKALKYIEGRKMYFKKRYFQEEKPALPTHYKYRDYYNNVTLKKLKDYIHLYGFKLDGYKNDPDFEIR